MKTTAGIQQNVTLVDGSLVAALPDIMQASVLKATTGSALLKWRLHTHFEVERYVPTRIDVTPDEGGPHDERAMLEQTLEAGRLYVMDRGYARFSLFNAIVGKYKGASTGPSSDGILRIATNLLDVPAEIITLLYLQR